MPIIGQPSSVRPEVLSDPQRGWRRMLRIDTTGANVNDVIRGLSEFLPEKVVYAEGDSWFDKFTPIPASGTNLLDAIRTPFLTAVVDVAHIGDEARDMVRGHQARQTRAMFDLFDFDAILLSAGGNDLKNVFAEMFDVHAQAAAGLASPFQPRDLAARAAALEPDTVQSFCADVAANVGRFVDLRNAARRERTRQAPIFLHGYDFLQPRPAGASLFVGSSLGSGPWLYPAMHAAGLTDAQMRIAADAVIKALNEQLQAVIAPLPNVFVIDQRGSLTVAAPGSQGSSADWLDEIHPNEAGFTKLARSWWDVPLSRALGWVPQAGDLLP